MNVDRAVLALAGGSVLVSVALATFVSTWWLLLTAFVGLNLVQYSVTGYCPAATVLGRFGLSSGCAFDAGSATSAPDRSRRVARTR